MCKRDSHWEVREPDGTRWFVSVDELRGDPSTSALDAAFSIAHAARAAGVVGVHAPVPATDGRLVHRVRRAWVVSVQPWLDGSARGFSDPLGDDEVEQVLATLAGLHAVRPSVTHAGRDGGGIPGRAELDALVGRLDDVAAWSGGPLATRVRDVLRDHRVALVAALAAHDADPVASGVVVPTHGEPHPGNLVRADGGVHLVDWDTAMLAAPERDLWLVAARTALDVATRYEELTGRPVDRARLRHFERRWALADVADFVPGLATATQEDEDTGWQWQALVRTLEDLGRLSTRGT